ncbi:MAG: hypothetical protein KC680_02830, partial [Candidatus Peregrinibacteria bacterium]|nr:hypothetical protein [Candidatus Peregrinibacteria bacterium]
MDNTTRNHIGWIITIIGSLLAASVPILFLKQITGSFVPTILPQLESDHLYYLTHVQKVLQGHGSLGNPYILEYRDAAFPGLRLPVYLSAIPGLLGLSIITTYNVSAVLYTLLTAGLLFVL